MLFLKNNLSKKVISMMLAFISVFFFMSGEFLVKVRASEKTIFTLNQTVADHSPTVLAASKDMYINDLSAIKRLVFSYGNSERHWYCDECGSIRASTTVTINVYGYLKENGNEESIVSYSLSGLDNASPRRATNQLILNDDIKSKYYNIKIAAYLSSCTAGRCSHDSPTYTYHSNGTGYVNVVSDTYDEPVIQTNGNLSNKTLTEGISDYIGIINAYFPGSSPKYTWQYSEGNSWISLEDGKTDYETISHGSLKLIDKNGGSSFSSSNAVRLDNPELSMNGLIFRAILSSDGSTGTAITNQAKISISSRNATGFYSARYANRYGQEGEALELSDVISYIRFNNGQIVDAHKLLNMDSRLVYYGFINPENISEKSVEEVLSGLNNGSISYVELGDSTKDHRIKSGNNDVYLKLTYRGTQEMTSFTAISFEGKDEIAPSFSEEALLYESDGVTVYNRGDYKISNESGATLRIIGRVTDTVSEESKISWAYTLTNTTSKEGEVKIPVYRKGTDIDVSVTRNGTYTLFAMDNSGNTAQKIINVKAFDETYPTLLVDAEAEAAKDNVVKSYLVTVTGDDAERLAPKPYFYKKFDSWEEANNYNLLSAPDSDFTKGNAFRITSEGYYLFAVKDAVGKITKEIMHLPEEGYEIDYSKPEISVNPVAIKELSGKLTEYDIDMMDNLSICKYEIIDGNGNVIVTASADNGDFEKGKKIINYRFVPKKKGEYKIKVYDYADNSTELKVNVTIREVESIAVTGMGDTMSVNSEISLDNLVGSGNIILNMNDGTSEIYSQRDDIDIKLIDKNGQETDKIIVDYGDNSFKLVVTVNPGQENENIIEYERSIYGEDNVAPLPGQLKEELKESWDGSLTNNKENTMTLFAEGCEDDGSVKEKLIVTWYRDDEIVSQKSIAEGGDVFGPFSGEEYNGTYRYTVTDEKGNISHSVSEKIVDCYDFTPPTGELKLLPEGVTADSKARFKQLQIVNASDNNALAGKPYSFNGNNEDSYTIISSIVAGENGSYDVYIKDSAGNVAYLGEINLTGIDSIAPTINGYEVIDGEDGKKILHVDASDVDSNGNENSDNLQYSIDGENYQDSPDFEITESGKNTIYVKDETGNVTRTDTDYTDTESPLITAYQDESGAGVILVNVTDNAGLFKVVMEDDRGNKEILQIYDGATEDTIRKDIDRIGDYTITVWDLSGNSEQATVNVPSIVPAASSSILTGLKLSPSNWTSGDVMVIAQLSDTEGLSSSPFRWNNSISTANTYYIAANNQDVTVDISDRYGNVVATQTVKVTNIDRNNPVIESLSQSEDKNHLVIKTYDSESGVAQVTISGGPYSVETNVVVLDGENEPEDVVLTLPTNGTYTVRVYDKAGNASQGKITVSGVTTDVPKIEYKEVVRTQTVDNVITNDRVVTQNVETKIPVIVPVPVKETVVQYKTLRDKGEDTSILIKGEDTKEIEETIIENDSFNNQKIESEKVIADEYDSQNQEIAKVGVYTKDGTYIAGDGYEYYGRVKASDKSEHPFKYFFKKNAEKIAVAATVLSILLLVLCIILCIIILKDYVKDQNEKRTINRLKKNESQDK